MVLSRLQRDNSNYVKIIESYENYLIGKDISVTPEHGDYYFGNILIDNMDNLFVIDWAYYKKEAIHFLILFSSLFKL